MTEVILKLAGGHHNIVHGKEYSASDPVRPFLCYSENGIWHAECSPESGALYDSNISIPDSDTPEYITVTVSDAAVTAAPLNAGAFRAELKRASAEFGLIRARRIHIYLGRGSANAEVAPLVAAEFECGKGRLDIMLTKNKRGYYYNILHGSGAVTVNSRLMPRRCRFGPPEGIPVNIRCGLGTINIIEC